VIHAGKALPGDLEGKRLIRHTPELKETLKDSVSVVFVRNYNPSLAKLITSGVDLWLNTPQPPLPTSEWSHSRYG
jgi:starch phosphorylase